MRMENHSIQPTDYLIATICPKLFPLSLFQVELLDNLVVRSLSLVNPCRWQILIRLLVSRVRLLVSPSEISNGNNCPVNFG